MSNSLLNTFWPMIQRIVWRIPVKSEKADYTYTILYYRSLNSCFCWSSISVKLEFSIRSLPWRRVTCIHLLPAWSLQPGNAVNSRMTRSSVAVRWFPRAFRIAWISTPDHMHDDPAASSFLSPEIEVVELWILQPCFKKKNMPQIISVSHVFNANGHFKHAVSRHTQKLSC